MASLNKKLVMELARSEYVLRRENVIAVGRSHRQDARGPWPGPSSLPEDLLGGFTTAAALVHELIEARNEKRLLRLQRHMAAYKLLVID